jgi:hypothetical protein
MARPTTRTFTAAGGTVFHHNAAYTGDVHIAPAVGEPPVEVPIDDLLAFVAHVVTERRKGQVFMYEREDSD